ncbi:hypothetical protein N9L94_04450 [Robiginitalea sp.]|nr:hypothetical protein [Robiginitalea sp.]
MRFTLLFLLLISMPIHAQELDFDKLTALKVRSIGPANMSGRITAIAVSHSDLKTIYVGAASGGVWKSENGGTAWKPVFDNQPTQNIGALAVDPNNPNNVWVGTGEGNPRNSVNLGMGIFKSEDGGNTWKHLGLENTKSIHRILIDPQDSNVIYAGALGDPFTPNPNRGVYKSINGGTTWERILFTNTTSGVADMIMHPENPNKLLVALYDHRRTPYSFVSGGPGSGLFVTEDGGKTWNQLGPEAGLPEGELGRIGIAMSPSEPNRVYAKIEAKKNALYRSEDGGLTWKLINDNPKFTNNRPFYFQDLAVDSKNPDRLYNIYQPLSVSYDGGLSFDSIPMIPADETKGIHADFHAMWINPEDPEHFIIGGDGGLGITTDHGKSWYFPETIPVAQFYQIAVDHERPFNVYGGMQDNGNWSGPAYTWKRGGIRTLYWQYLVGGDGFYISPDLDNPRFGYGTSQNGDLYRYDKLTGFYQSIAPSNPNPEIPLRFNWNAGFARDPFNPDGAYYGSQFVHYTHDKGQTWNIISPDLSTNNPEHQKGDYGGLTLDISGAENYNSILSIAPSRLDKKVIWVGTDDGRIYLTQNGGATWQDCTKNIKGLPSEAWVARIIASPHSAATAWAVVNNYRKGDYTPYLFRTDNYGKTWKQVLENSPVKGYTLAFVQDPVVQELQFLGTENGLWITHNNGVSWSQVHNGFPSVSTRDLVIQEPESALVIGTFGRAIWVLDDLQSLRTVIAKPETKPLRALPVNEVVQVKGLFIAPPGNIWTGFHTTFEGQNRPFQQVELPFYLNREPLSSDSILVHITAQNGDTLNRQVAKNLNKGLNYITWKLDASKHRLPGAWITEESRGIPVLPGTYTAVFEWGEQKATTPVVVVADPRFEDTAEADASLYQFQKKLNDLVLEFNTLYNRITKEEERLKNLKTDTPNPELEQRIEDARKLRLKGRDRAVNRQVGAWQSTKSTPHSVLSRLEMVAMSRLQPISAQEWERLKQSTELLKQYALEVNTFLIQEE